MICKSVRASISLEGSKCQGSRTTHGMDGGLMCAREDDLESLSGRYATNEVGRCGIMGLPPSHISSESPSPPSISEG